MNKPPMLRRPQENISQDPGVLSSRFLAQLFDMHHEYDDSIGEIVLPFCSLINHSCSPNVARCSSENQRVILFAMRPIRKGEQVWNIIFLPFWISYQTYIFLSIYSNDNYILDIILKRF